MSSLAELRAKAAAARKASTGKVSIQPKSKNGTNNDISVVCVPVKSGTVTVASLHKALKPLEEECQQLHESLTDETLEFVHVSSDEVTNNGALKASETYRIRKYTLVEDGESESPTLDAATEQLITAAKAAGRKVVLGYSHKTSRHQPENPRIVEGPVRIQRAVRELLESPLVSQCVVKREELEELLAKTSARKRQEEDSQEDIFSIPVREVTVEEVCAVHDPSIYVPFLKEEQPLDLCLPTPTTNGLPGETEEYTGSSPSASPLSPLPTDVYCSKDGASAQAAKLAAGITVEGAKLVAPALRTAEGSQQQSSLADSCFCVIRPPGHHCGPSQPNGFCLINNVAIALRAVQRQYKEEQIEVAPRFLIIDFDVHHGEGTQALVEDDPNIAFISLHRYDEGRFFPKTGHLQSVGLHRQMMNIPFDTEPNSLSEGGYRTISDYAFEQCTSQLIIPTLNHFQPHMVFISCGFDAAVGDPLGGMAVVNGFGLLVSKVAAKCKQRGIGLACVLEGGYSPQNVADGTMQVVTALLMEQEFPVSAPPTWETVKRKITRRIADLKQQAADAEEKRRRIEEEQKDGEEGSTEEPPKISAPPVIKRDEELLALHRHWVDEAVARVKEVHVGGPLMASFFPPSPGKRSV